MGFVCLMSTQVQVYVCWCIQVHSLMLHTSMMDRYLKTGAVAVFLLQAQVPAWAGGSSAQIPLPTTSALNSALKLGGSRPDVSGHQNFRSTFGLVPKNVSFACSKIPGEFLAFLEVRRNLSGSTAHRYFRPCSASISANIFSGEKGSIQNFQPLQPVLPALHKKVHNV
jgi:hypothetical protein